MFSSQQAYRLFHLQKTRYLALKALGQWCSSARWKASVCTSSGQNTPKTEQLWRQPGAMSDRKSTFWHLPSMCCSHPVLKGWAEGPLLYLVTPKAAPSLPSAEEGARKLLTWKPCTLKRCYSIHPASPLAPCAPHFGVLQTRQMTRKGHFPPTLEEPSQITLTGVLNDKQPWALFEDTEARHNYKPFSPSSPSGCMIHYLSNDYVWYKLLLHEQIQKQIWVNTLNRWSFMIVIYFSIQLSYFVNSSS